MILWNIEYDCADCPQGCINCGRKEGYKALYSLTCDLCGEDCDKLYNCGSKQLCSDCILKDYEEINEENFEEFI